MTSTEQTLSEALAEIGIRHEKSKIDGLRDLYAADGEFLGSYDARDGWKYLKSVVQHQERA